MCQGAWTDFQVMRTIKDVRRSGARLWGRNLTRNSRIDGAPMRTSPWAARSVRGLLCFVPIGHRSLCL